MYIHVYHVDLLIIRLKSEKLVELILIIKRIDCTRMIHVAQNINKSDVKE